MKTENTLTLKELKEELKELRMCKNNTTMYKHSRLYLKKLRDEAFIKKHDMRISPETYGDLTEIEFRCTNLISKMESDYER